MCLSPANLLSRLAPAPSEGTGRAQKDLRSSRVARLGLTLHRKGRDPRKDVTAYLADLRKWPCRHAVGEILSQQLSLDGLLLRLLRGGLMSDLLREALLRTLL